MDLTTEFGTGWTDRLRNLQKIHAALITFTNKVVEKGKIETPFSNCKIPHFQVDLLPIAFSQDIRQTINLLQHVVFAVLHSDAKETMVTRILQLNEQSQEALMHFIKLVNEDEDYTSLTPSRQIKQLKRAQETLSSHLVDVQTEFETIAKEKERIERENSDLKMDKTDLETRLTHGLQRRNITPDSITLALELKLSEKDQMILQLTDELAEAKKVHEQTITFYKDELDQLSGKVQNLLKIEQNAQILRETIEDLKPMKEQLKLLQEENEALKRKSAKSEEDGATLFSLTKQLAQCKETLAQEKKKKHALEDEMHQKDAQVKKTIKEKTELSEKLEITEAKLREFSMRPERMSIESNQEDSFIFMSPARVGVGAEAPVARSDTLSVFFPVEDAGFQHLQRSSDLTSSLRNEKFLKEILSLANENKALKEEKERLSEELAGLQRDREAEQITESAKLTAVKKGLEREVGSLREALNGSETTLRDEYRKHADEITQLTATFKAAELISASALEELHSLKQEKDTQSEELAQIYKEKDELTAKFISSRDETLKLNSQLSEKIREISDLKKEIDVLKAANSEKSKEKEEDVRKNYKEEINILTARISALEAEVKTRDVCIDEGKTVIETLRERLNRAKLRHLLNKSEISHLSHLKTELSSVLSKERNLLASVTSEMCRTMTDLDGLLEVKTLDS